MNDFFSGGNGSTFFPGSSAADNAIEWVALDLTSVVQVDPAGFISALSYDSATSINTVTYRNTSGVPLNGIDEGAKFTFNLQQTLPGFSYLGGDTLLVKITAIETTPAWFRLGFGVGFSFGAFSSAISLFSNNTGTSYAAMRNTGGGAFNGAVVAADLATQDIVSTGLIGTAPSAGAVTGTVAVALEGLASTVAGATFAGPATDAGIVFFAIINAYNATDFGTRTGQARIEVARIPYPV